MTKREMLKYAAKAAGYKVSWVDQYDCGLTDTHMVPLPEAVQHFRFKKFPHEDWRPLTDDGDEACLEAALGLNVLWCDAGVFVGRHIHGPAATASWEFYKDHGGDKQAARRNAGVRAAAEIGRSMP